MILYANIFLFIYLRKKGNWRPYRKVIYVSSGTIRSRSGSAHCNKFCNFRCISSTPPKVETNEFFLHVNCNACFSTATIFISNSLQREMILSNVYRYTRPQQWHSHDSWPPSPPNSFNQITRPRNIFRLSAKLFFVVRATSDVTQLYELTMWYINSHRP